MSRVLSCPKCPFETTDPLAKCPNCGRTLQSAKKVRVLGWLLVTLGTFLVIFMGGLGIVLGGIIARTGQPGASESFTGDPEMIVFIAVVFGLVILFGLLSMAAGGWQIWYGKPNKPLRIVMLVVVGLLFLIGGAVRLLND